MSAFDGILKKRWEVHCRVCEVGNLGLHSSEKPDAISELRRDGWGMRGGWWICGACKEAHPRGKPLPATPDATSPSGEAVSAGNRAPDEHQ